MNANEPLITRRRALHLSFALAGTALAQSISSLLANDSAPAPTPENVLGPFYPVIRSMEKDADLTTIRGHKQPAEGKIIHLMGRVLDLKGEPVKGARVEIWQANTHGRYAHVMDPNPAPLDPNFQGYAVQVTDKEGLNDEPSLFLTHYTGHPSVAIPNGSGTSLIFVGRQFDEATILEFAKAYQDQTTFHTGFPPVFVK